MLRFLKIRRFILSLFRSSGSHEAPSGKARSESSLYEKDSDNLAVVLRKNAEINVSRAAENIAAHMGISLDAQDAAKPFSEKIQKSVVQPLSQIESLCAEYAHGIYAPNFPKIVERLSSELTASNWTDGNAYAIDKSLQFQSCISALPKENRYRFTPEELLEISKQAKQHEDAFLSEKQDKWEEYLIKTFVVDGIQDLIFFMKYRKMDWGSSHLDLIVYFPDTCRPIFLNNVRSSIVYHAFNQSFFDGPDSAPAERKIEGHNRIRGRDGTETRV
jgi:hypothetical protein